MGGTWGRARYLLQHGLWDCLQLRVWVVQQSSTKFGEAHAAALHCSLGQGSVRPPVPARLHPPAQPNPQKPLCKRGRRKREDMMAWGHDRVWHQDPSCVLPQSRPCPTALCLPACGREPLAIGLGQRWGWRGGQGAEPPRVGRALTQCRHRSRISWNTLAAVCRVGSGKRAPDPAGSAGSSSISTRPPRSSPISWEEDEGHGDQQWGCPIPVLPHSCPAPPPLPQGSRAGAAIAPQHRRSRVLALSGRGDGGTPTNTRRLAARWFPSQLRGVQSRDGLFPGCWRGGEAGMGGCRKGAAMGGCRAASREPGSAAAGVCRRLGTSWAT